MLLEKIVAVVNGEVLTLQDFEDHLALRSVLQPRAGNLDRQQALQRLVDQTLIQQEAIRTRIVEVDEAEVTQYLRAVEEQPDRQVGLMHVMQGQDLTMGQVRSWVRHQLIVHAFIERRIRLFVRVSDTQIAQYYDQHQQAIGAPFSDAVRQEIQRLLVEQQVNARLDGLVEDLRRKASLDFPP
jgi:hypothetical protein